MVKRAITTYKKSFSGLSKEVWWLALITFVNRAGTMVLPFLSLYLTEDLNLSKPQVGWVMAAFGVGSLAGSWLGGKLTQSFGYYSVMFWSLLTTGFMFLGLQYVTTFTGFVIGIFLTMAVADTFRPAMFLSLKAYSKPENQTRSLTLIRLAINLGFSFGPFLGGIIISTLDYSGLFWVDGLTCISAILLMRVVLNPKKVKEQVVENKVVSENTATSVFKDYPYIIFLTVVFIMGFIFLQLFTTMPLYYNEVHNLTEVQIGLLMSVNGFFIFLLEMPLIHYIEEKLLNKMKIITWSLVLMALSYLVLNVSGWSGVLIVGMLFVTVGEMLAFPFTNNFAMNRAPSGKDGMYLAYYTMAFSWAHIFSAKTGMEIIDRFGFDANWYVMGGLGFVAVFLMVVLQKLLKKEREVKI
ncbi:Predicted arabinose efflux permease, MFS family [Lutibacter oricola]|uniref:Predicted arabinose efflux permease, MFS family n=1 Tax=Lutibacter oricola TaxID=762486 RepID=A0A1H2YMU6_9FLAO|nr:MFS transporter [Lutibacter oricola]SDX06390.1 Predicted arabinose efflux permease, MFS family [Lutibacter oricola]